MNQQSIQSHDEQSTLSEVVVFSLLVAFASAAGVAIPALIVSALLREAMFGLGFYEFGESSFLFPPEKELTPTGSILVAAGTIAFLVFVILCVVRTWKYARRHDDPDISTPLAVVAYFGFLALLAVAAIALLRAVWVCC